MPNIFGNTRKLLIHKIKETQANVLTLRTHNQKMYFAAASLANKKDNVFPNFNTEIPQEVISLLKQHTFLNNADENLVVKGAYTDEKTQQTIPNKGIEEKFKEKLGKFDARAVIVYLN